MSTDLVGTARALWMTCVPSLNKRNRLISNQASHKVCLAHWLSYADRSGPHIPRQLCIRLTVESLQELHMAEGRTGSPLPRCWRDVDESPLKF